MTHLKWTELVFSAQLIIIFAQFGFNSGSRLLLNGPAHKGTNDKIDGLGSSAGNNSPGLGARGTSSKRFGAAMRFGGLPKLGIPAFSISGSVETDSLPSWGWLPDIRIPGFNTSRRVDKGSFPSSGMGAEPSSKGRPSNAPVTNQVDGGILHDLHGSDRAGGVGSWSGYGGGLPELGVPGFCDSGNVGMGLVRNIGLCAPSSSPVPANGQAGGDTGVTVGVGSASVPNSDPESSGGAGAANGIGYGSAHTNYGFRSNNPVSGNSVGTDSATKYDGQSINRTPKKTSNGAGGGTVLNLGSSSTNNEGTQQSVGTLTAEVDRAFSSTPKLYTTSGGSKGNDVHQEEHSP